MGNKRRKIVPLVPVGKAPSVSAKPVTSLKLARKLTGRFHALLNEEGAVAAVAQGAAPPSSAAAAAPPPGARKNSAPAAAIPSAPPSSSAAATAAERLRAIRAEMLAMGGRDAYQEASALATKHFRSSRYIFKNLVGFGLQPRRGQAPLRVLEIGAVNGQLSVCPWLRTRAIDLVSREPRYVEAIDFFDVPVASAPAGEYDIVVNAMVMNCVPDAARRGEMLIRCHDHLAPGGLCFFALPSRCIDMSAHVTRRRMEALIRAAGFTIREDHRTPKISFYILQRTDGADIRRGRGGGEGVGGEGGLHSVASVFIAGTDRAALFGESSEEGAKAPHAHGAVSASTAASAGAAPAPAAVGAAKKKTKGAPSPSTAAAAGAGRRPRVEDAEELLERERARIALAKVASAAEPAAAAPAAAGVVGGSKRKRAAEPAAAAIPSSSSASGAAFSSAVGGGGGAESEEASSSSSRLPPLPSTCCGQGALAELRVALQAASSAYAAAHAKGGGGGGAAAAVLPWRPLLLCADARAASEISGFFAPPLKDLPPDEMPHTGFLRTDFAITLPHAWIKTKKTN